MVPSHGSETTTAHITDETDARLACCSEFELVTLDRLTVHDHHEHYSMPAIEVLARVQNVQVQGLLDGGRPDSFQWSPRQVPTESRLPGFTQFTEMKKGLDACGK